MNEKTDENEKLWDRQAEGVKTQAAIGSQKESLEHRKGRNTLCALQAGRFLLMAYQSTVHDTRVCRSWISGE